MAAVQNTDFRLRNCFSKGRPDGSITENSLYVVEENVQLVSIDGSTREYYFQL